LFDDFFILGCVKDMLTLGWLRKFSLHLEPSPILLLFGSES
jgi:hypothetical protein